MRTAEDFVELARKRHNCSYYRVAKHLEITPSRLLQVRRGDISLTEPQAEKLAELIDLEPGIVYAESKAARAKRTDVRAFWERVARSLAASLVLVCVGLFAPAQDARAAWPGAVALAQVIHYAKWLARWWARRRARVAQVDWHAADTFCY